MIRGTTPKNRFILPFGSEMIKTIEITYKQKYKTIFKKKNEDCKIDGNTVTVSLTQEDTFLFDDSSSVKIQVRVLTPSNEVVASKPIFVSVEECLSDEVLK